MSKACEMLNILKRECEEAEEQLLAYVCDNCHWPYVLISQEDMDERCKTCTVESNLKALLKKARTIAVGETMQITAEEMFPKEVNKHDSD